MNNWNHRPFLVVISAPSGTGKTTICRLTLKLDEKLAYSISATTRKMREGEKNGYDYYFVDKDTFSKWIEEGKLVEWSTIYGEYYGTPIEPIKTYLDQGRDVLLDLDKNGKDSLERLFPGNVVSIFLIPPGIEELKKRLITRGVESEEKLKVRLKTMKEELGWAIDYDYWVLNDEKELARDRVYSIIRAERMKRKRLDEEILKDLQSKME